MSDDILKQIGYGDDLSDNASDSEFILSTLDVIPNMDIEKHYGFVSGSVLLTRNPIKEFLVGLKNYYGGNSKGLLENLEGSRKEAIKIMITQATEIGANSIIGLRFENITVSFSAIEVRVYGSAIKGTKY
jgi:uncharacterized protein YbjQ (UPF0145 family)